MFVCFYQGYAITLEHEQFTFVGRDGSRFAGTSLVELCEFIDHM